jgi:hypothetical protein
VRICAKKGSDVGYCSNWALVIQSEDAQVLADFEVWLAMKAKDEECPMFCDSPKTFTYFEQDKDEELSHPTKNGYLTYTNDYTKCSQAWDDMITSIGEYCDEHKIFWEYVRIGEELSDIELLGNYYDHLITVNVSLLFTS